MLDGWEVVGQGDSDVLLGDGDNSFVYAVTGTVDPSTDAASVISASMDSILPKQSYTQLKKTDIAALESFGSVVSMAGMQYRATWTDQQASVPLQGLLICAVRQDGTAIIMTAEHAPPEGVRGQRQLLGAAGQRDAGVVRGVVTRCPEVALPVETPAGWAKLAGSSDEYLPVKRARRRGRWRWRRRPRRGR